MFPFLKRKPLTPEQQEANRTKDFFNCIAPTTIAFLPDWYRIGDSCRCAWAVREYPHSTEEQAIFAQLADHSGVTIRIYLRPVGKAEEHQATENAKRRNKLQSADNNLSNAIKGEIDYNTLLELIMRIHMNEEVLLHCAIFLELKANSPERLNELQNEISSKLTRAKVSVDRLTMRQQEGFLSVMPIGSNQFGEEFERMLPASSIANLYPLSFSGKTDPHGMYIGRDKFGSNILVDFDRRTEDKTNSNILILGNSGQGKSHLMKLLLTNLRESGKRIICLDPEQEYMDVCEAYGGCYIDFMSGKYTINLLEPKAWGDSM